MVASIARTLGILLFAAVTGCLLASHLEWREEIELLAEVEASCDGAEQSAGLLLAGEFSRDFRHRLADALARGLARSRRTELGAEWLSPMPLPSPSGAFEYGASERSIYVQPGALLSEIRRGVRATSDAPWSLVEEGYAEVVFDLRADGESKVHQAQALYDPCPFFAVAAAVSRPITLRRNARVPTFVAKVDGEAPRPIAQGDVVVIPPGKRFSLHAEDASGITELLYDFEGIRRDTLLFDSPAPTSTSVPLPTAVVSSKMRRRIPLLLVATNALGNGVRSEGALLLQEENWNPVLALRLAGRTLEEGSYSDVRIPGGPQEIRAILAPDLVPGECEQLVIAHRDSRIPLLVGEDGALVGQLQAPDQGREEIQLLRGDRVLARYAFVADGAFPIVRLLARDGSEIMPGAHALPPGEEITLVIEDDSSLQMSDQIVSCSLSEGGAKEQGEKLLVFSYRIGDWETGTLRVSASDALGNRTQEHTWDFRTAQPARVTALSVGGRDPAADAIAFRIKEVTVAVDSEGDGDLLVTVEDPARGAVLSTMPWRRFTGSRGVFSVSLGVEAGEDQDRVLAVRHLDGSAVEQVSVRVDRSPPTLRVPGQDTSGVLILPQNQSTWRVLASDGRTPPSLTVSGALILATKDLELGTREFTLSIPESLPSLIHLEARDSAGNRTVLKALLRRP
jgi:hypothetical protein